MTSALSWFNINIDQFHLYHFLDTAQLKDDLLPAFQCYLGLRSKQSTQCQHNGFSVSLFTRE